MWEEDKTLIEKCHMHFEKLKEAAISYALARVQRTGGPEKAPLLEAAYNRYAAILKEYVEYYIPCARPIEESEIFHLMKDRKKTGDLACYFLFIAGVDAAG